MKTILIILLIFATPFYYAQDDTDNRKTIELSGAIVDGDSLIAIPYTHITIKNTNLGTIADYYGFFSFIARESDTIIFSSLGYQSNQFIIPDTLSGNKYSIIHMMYKDTLNLNEVKVFPWPTYEEFRKAFVELEISDDDEARAYRNLDRKNLMMTAETLPIDGSTIYKQSVQNQHTRLYLAGGPAPISLLNPIAWSQFIAAWKNGDFKKKENINYLPK